MRLPLSLYFLNTGLSEKARNTELTAVKAARDVMLKAAIVVVTACFSRERLMSGIYSNLISIFGIDSNTRPLIVGIVLSNSIS